MSQESGHGLAGNFRLKVSHEIAVKLSGWATVSSEDSPEVRYTSKLISVVVGPSPSGPLHGTGPGHDSCLLPGQAM